MFKDFLAWGQRLYRRRDVIISQLKRVDHILDVADRSELLQLGYPVTMREGVSLLTYPVDARGEVARRLSAFRLHYNDLLGFSRLWEASQTVVRVELADSQKPLGLGEIGLKRWVRLIRDPVYRVEGELVFIVNLDLELRASGDDWLPRLLEESKIQLKSKSRATQLQACYTKYKERSVSMPTPPRGIVLGEPVPLLGMGVVPDVTPMSALEDDIDD